MLHTLKENKVIEDRTEKRASEIVQSNADWLAARTKDFDKWHRGGSTVLTSPPLFALILIIAALQ